MAKAKKKSSFWQSRELKGLWLLCLALLTLLSQLSFASGNDPKNFFGLVGWFMGWIVHSLFGISGYLIAAFVGWVGWRWLFSKSTDKLPFRIFCLVLAVSSLSLILSVTEEETPRLYQLLRTFFFPGVESGVQLHRLHVGGHLFYYLYQDMPLFAIKGLFHTAGTLLIAIPMLFFSITYLLKIAPATALLKWLSERRARKAQAAAVLVAEVEPQLILDEPTPFFSTLQREEPRFVVKLPKIEKLPYKKSSRPSKDEFVEGQYRLPPLDLLHPPKKQDNSQIKQNLKKQATILEETLQSFGIETKVGKINVGPTITSFEVQPSIGVKVQKIKALENDIALNMEAKSIRIIAPIPGKAAVGIEVPNIEPQEVSFKEMMEHYQTKGPRSKIPVLLGKAVDGEWVLSDLAKMPHCIIAGATGSGKSVCINTIVISIIMNNSPDQVRLLMVDPKKVELTGYSQLPHMLAPVITEPKEACHALNWLVREMEKRYEILKLTQLRNIDAFNARTSNPEKEKTLGIEIPEKMPYYVAIIDELADLMMVSQSDIETPITRIAQMARAVGIHLILATQRPSREVITGLIKANFPTRIAFKVANRINSQIIIDDVGAESLLGNGDMLFLAPGTSQLVRAQGAFIRDDEIRAIVEHAERSLPTQYLIQSFEKYESPKEENQEPENELYKQAKEIILSTGKASATYLQTSMKIGYPTAARLIDELEARGVIGPKEGAKGRQVFAGRPFSEDEEF